MDSWSDFLGRLKEGIISDMLYIKDRGGYIKIVVESFCDGEPLAYTFRLLPLDSPTLHISQFILKITKQLKISQKLKEENTKLKEQTHQLQLHIDNNIQSQSYSLFDGDLDSALASNENKAKPNGTNVAKKKAYHMKRKPGYSLVNPHTRRKVAMGAKIGE